MLSSGETNQPATAENKTKAKAEPKHWLEYLIFFFVIVTAGATGFAAWYTRQQWIVAADQEQKSLRAYILIPGSSGTDKPLPVRLESDNGVPNAWVALQNEGQTPAYDVRIAIAVRVLPVPIPSGFDFPTHAVYLAGMLGPHATKHSSRHADGGALNDPTMDAIKKGLMAVYLYGTVSYRDIFGQDHWTNYCGYWYPPNSQDDVCRQHNDTDDQPDPPM